MATTRLLSAMVATWNNVATTFTGLKFNVTDTASAAGSLLADLQVGGVSKFRVDKAGVVTAASSVVVPSITLNPASGVFFSAQAYIQTTADGVFKFSNWGSTSQIIMTAGASGLATFNGGLTTGGSVLIPAANNFAFVGRGGLGATADGVLRLTNSTGTITTDITLSGASAVGASTATFGGSIVTAANVFLGPASGVIWAGHSILTSPADGNVVLYNQAGTSFGLLQFGGTTSSFPAIKRSATVAAFRLADDSADASITAASVTASTFLKSGSYTVATVPSPVTAGPGAHIYVANEAGGAVAADSDGTDWRRTTDRAIIS